MFRFHLHPFSSLLNFPKVKIMRPSTVPVLASMFTFSPHTHRSGNTIVISSLAYRRENVGFSHIRKHLENDLKRFSTTDDHVTISANGNITSILPFQPHPHNSLLIIVPDLDSNSSINHDMYTDKNIFSSSLQGTILSARAMKKSTIWIQIPMSRSSLIEQLLPLGFQYHRAQGSVAHLYLWLNDSIPCKIPEYATHQVVRHERIHIEN
jgi:hypothetical protein